MKLTIHAKSPAGYETTIEEEGGDLVALLDQARTLEMELARRGYTPTHPRPYREKLTEFEQIRREYGGYQRQRDGV